VIVLHYKEFFYHLKRKDIYHILVYYLEHILKHIKLIKIKKNIWIWIFLI